MITIATSTPAADGFTMPAEWAEQQAVWMIWPFRPDNWREEARFVQKAFANVADAIGAATPVFMGVPAQFMEQARAIMPAHVTLVEMNSDDCWARDTGPTIVTNSAGECRGVNWGFNAWGGRDDGLYFPWDQDERVAANILAHHGMDRYKAPLILEGGSIHVDGEGTLLTTAECLLNKNRNRFLSKEQIEAYLAEYLGVSSFIWIDQGCVQDETDGHIDNMCCFVRPGEVALLWTEDESDPQYARSVSALKVLEAAVDAKGRKLKVWKLPQPGPLYRTKEESDGIEKSDCEPREAGDRLAGSYVNFLITNNRIIYPLLDPTTDGEAQRIFESIFPNHIVIGVLAREILLGGGNIHCITQQIPYGKITLKPTYSYSPKRLLESFRTLKSKEEKCQQMNPMENLYSKASTKTRPSSSSSFVVAAVQLTAGGLNDNNVEGFWDRAQHAIRMAAQEKGADLILLPELFLGPYFCQSQEACLQNLAMEILDDNDGSNCNFLVKRMQALAKQYEVVLPISLYERRNNALYNSVVVIDADGSVLGTYRKSHIPDGTGYQEKFYFTPGDTGFKVWQTRVGKVGVAICWDQWFPEVARAMALQGADVLLYPSAIGSEPQDPSMDSADRWQRVMMGHAAANMVPVVATNRYGTEILMHDDGKTEKQRITFYGRSFITDETGAKVAEAEMESENDPICILTSTIDPDWNRSTRLAWGLFRDRRPELYGILQTKDGSLN